MSSSILYYPSIEFQPGDYQWLWCSALLWDRVYRIVPQEYQPEEPKNISELCESGEIGIGISPNRYAKEASNRFLDFLQSDNQRAAALSFVDRDEVEHIRIHSSKMDEKLRSQVFYHIKGKDFEEEWLSGSSEMINAYMTFLAKEIAEKNKLSLYTGEQSLWTMTEYFRNDGKLQDMYYQKKGTSEYSVGALLSIILSEVFPQNILDIESKEILKFRQKRKDERRRFIVALENIQEQINNADAPEVVETIFINEKKELDDALSEYKKSMDILGAVKFGGYLTTAIGVGASIYEALNGIPPFLSGGIGLSGVAINVLTGIAEKRVQKKDNPYSYLAHVRSSFSRACNSGLPYNDVIGEYNYKLSRGIEEFICD